MTYQASIDSPLGPIALTSDGDALTHIDIGTKVANPSADAVIESATRQLGEYFAGTRKNFDLPLKVSGTRFQEAIWSALQAIPHGETISY